VTLTVPKRLRGRRLQELRRLVFDERPLCVRCEANGKARIAVHLDHIKPLYQGGTDELENLQGLCFVCHTEKTVADMGYRKRVKVGLDGYPQD
jgi:5-methylcytosine-specific restriction enzyme A